jgi:hypothetical protein
MAAAGVGFLIGREVAGQGHERLNGYLGTAKPSPSVNTAQPEIGSKQKTYRIDPFLVPGDPASGLIAGVTQAPETPLGGGDGLTQAFNFRMTLQTDPALRRPLSRPSNYDPRAFELLGRLFAAAKSDRIEDISIWDVLKPSELHGSTIDCNSMGGFSTDLVGSGTAFSLAKNQDERLHCCGRCARTFRACCTT